MKTLHIPNGSFPVETNPLFLILKFFPETAKTNKDGDMPASLSLSLIQIRKWS